MACFGRLALKSVCAIKFRFAPFRQVCLTYQNWLKHAQFISTPQKKKKKKKTAKNE